PAHGPDVADEAVLGHRDDMETLARAGMRADTDEAPQLAVSLKVVQVLVEWNIGQAVAVVRQKLGIVAEIALDSFQPLANVRVHSGLGERDLPAIDVAAEQPDGPTPFGQLEVGGEALVVVEEVLLDLVPSIPEAEDEFCVPIVGVVPHQMPDDRAISDGHHRLRDRIRVLAGPGAHAPAEQDDFHVLTPSSRSSSSLYRSTIDVSF